MHNTEFLEIAMAEAIASKKEGGIPVSCQDHGHPRSCSRSELLGVQLTQHTQIGAVLVSKDGKILGRGRNERVQKGSAILHVSPHP